MLLILIFKILPLTGAMRYTMVPFVLPEIPLSPSNVERMIPLHVLWCGAPLWEVLASILFTAMYWAEPILFCVFMRSVALSIQDEWLQERTLSLMQLAFGQVFMVIAYNLLSITGTSPVLVGLLWVVNLLWRAFRQSRGDVSAGSSRR